MPPFPDRVAESATVDIQVGGDWWIRARCLTVTEAAEAGELLSLALALVTPQDGRARQKKHDKERIRRAELAVDRLLCVCITEGSTDGGIWEPLRFVTDFNQQAPDQGKLWVGLINPHQRGLLLNQILLHYIKAREVLHPFRDDPALARVAGLVRETLLKYALRPDTISA